MAKAIWNGTTIAQSNNTIVVEGNHYFPPESLKMEFFTEVSKTTVCGWKGTANYYDITVDGKVNNAGAWIYKNPKDAAKEIKDHVAFWGGIQVTS